MSKTYSKSERTIGISLTTWKELSLIKINEELESLDDVIKLLLKRY
jgi:predicted CopG family antitoxin